MSHICTCADCDVDAFASICKFEAELAQQQAINQAMVSTFGPLLLIAAFPNEYGEDVKRTVVKAAREALGPRAETIDRGDPYLWESGT